MEKQTHGDFPGVCIYRRDRSRFWYVDEGQRGQGRRRWSTGCEDPNEAWDVYRSRLRQSLELSFQEAVVAFFKVKSTRLKPATLRGYKFSLKAVDPVFGNLFLNEIDVPTIKRFIQLRREKVSDASVRRDLAFMSTVFTFAQIEMDKPAPELNPFTAFSKKHLKETKRTRYLSEAEFRRLDAACTQEIHRVILLTAVHTGMRHGELLAFEKSWINWNRGRHGEINLPESITKNGKPRNIPIVPELADTLRDWCARAPGEHVFTHWSQEKQAHVPFTSFQGFFRLVRNRAGLKDLRIHDLRHTFASWWVQKGGDLMVLRDLLGHSDLQMVERYSHLDTKAAHRAIDEMN